MGDPGADTKGGIIVVGVGSVGREGYFSSLHHTRPTPKTTKKKQKKTKGLSNQKVRGVLRCIKGAVVFTVVVYIPV